MEIFSCSRFKFKFASKAVLAIFYFVVSLISFFPLTAQNSTLYLMPSIPQANQLNPALMHPCRFYLSLPVISSVRMNIRNTGFGYKDVFYTDNTSASTDYYIDPVKLDEKLRRINYSLVNADVDLLGLGFAVSDWYFTLGVSSHTSIQGSYPHDIVLLQDQYWNINSASPMSVRLNNIVLNTTSWNSISVSVSREVKKGLRIGARAKYLNGIVNTHNINSSIALNSTQFPSEFRAQINYGIKSSLPMELGLDPSGHVNSISFKPAGQNLLSNYIFNGNRGFALDAGLVYDIDEATQLSASIIDFGFIRWKKNLNEFSVNETYVFTGADLNQIYNDPGQTDLANIIVDSLSNSVYALPSAKRYYTSLPFSLYGGITREIAPNIKAGAMTWIEINSGHIRPSATFSINFTPFRAFAASFSYTMMNNKFNQIGTGLAFGNQGAQFYIITDNIVVRYTKDRATSYLWPTNARMLSLRFGINLFFGCNKKEKSSTAGSGHRYPKSKSRDKCAAYW